jgi:hypothetical protein
MSRRIASANVGELRLAAQFRPHLVDRLGRRVHEVDPPLVGLLDPRREIGPETASGITFGLGVPDLLHLEQSAVSSTNVVLAELERGPPARSFEFATIGLLQDRAVLALTHQTLTWRGKGSGDHGAHHERRPLWSVSPDCL